MALALVCGSAWAQVSTSPNLVPLPNHWTTNGQSVAQSYAINQALALSGSDVRINGFDYGYQYNLGSSWTQCTATNQDGSCSWTMTFNPRVDVNVSIRSNTNTQIYGTTHTETGVNTGNRSRDFQYRFTDPRDLLSLGNFNYTASTSPNSTVFGMYSRAVYTVDPCVADPQSSPTCPGFKTYHTFGDDTWVNVPLKFPFPFYGQVFTNSFMFSNGVVGFMSVGQQPSDAFCCAGEPINNGSTRFNYTIAPLNTDLMPQANSVFWTQGTNEHQRYVWENISEISNGNNLNTFGVEIKPSGYIGLRYQSVNVTQPTTSAIVGNAALGEYTQNFHGSGFTTTTVPGLIEYQSTGSICTSNPLASPQCPGYQQAYFTQQCSVNPLYNSACPGYAQAYFNQQCTANPLSNASCPGYATAFLNQQCLASPLFSVDCAGYAQATQQCSVNPLSASYCPAYQTASAQCQANPLNANYCPGYSTAVTACSSNPLSNSLCSGYQAANTACSANQLTYTYCPQYTAKLLACSADSQSNTMCPGYKTVTAQETTSTATVTEVAAAPTTESVAIKDSTVAAAIAAPSATSATSVTSVIAPPPPTAPAASPTAKAVEAATATPVASVAKQEEQKTESKKTDAAVAAVEKKAASAPAGGNRSEAARAAAVQRAKELTAEAGKAETLEAQTAVQGAVLGLMNYVPGFSAYQNSTVPDVLGAQVIRQYGKPPVDNARSQRLLGGANERLWRELVDSQYK